jgi:hypothetical protein
MAKIQSNVVLHGVSGMVGGQVVVRRARKGYILATKPHFTAAPTDTQVAQRKAFKDAVNYAKGAQGAPEYQALADSRGVSAFNVAVADFFNPPAIEAIDVSEYKGAAGETITIRASDDVKVAKVSVLITTEGGSAVENGEATPSSSGAWTYTSTKDAPQGALHILVSASDLAGHTAEQAATH